MNKEVRLPSGLYYAIPSDGRLSLLDSAVDRCSARLGEVITNHTAYLDAVVIDKAKYDSLVCEVGNLMEAARRVTDSKR